MTYKQLLEHYRLLMEEKAGNYKNIWLFVWLCEDIEEIKRKATEERNQQATRHPEWLPILDELLGLVS